MPLNMLFAGDAGGILLGLVLVDPRLIRSRYHDQEAFKAALIVVEAGERVLDDPRGPNEVVPSPLTLRAFARLLSVGAVGLEPTLLLRTRILSPQKGVAGCCPLSQNPHK
jgi:hypothetical protein